MQAGQRVRVNNGVNVEQVEAMFGFNPVGREGVVIEHCHGTGQKNDPNVYYVEFDSQFAVLFDFELVE